MGDIKFPHQPKANKMKTIYTDTINNEEYNAAAYQMAQAGYASIAIQAKMIGDENYRDVSEAEIARFEDAIRTIAERQFK